MPLSAATPPRRSPSWQPIAAGSEHLLSNLDGREVGQGVALVAEAGPRNRAGSERFRLFLKSSDFGVTTLPVAAGLFELGGRTASPWIEVTHYRGQLPLTDGRQVDVPDGILFQVLESLAEQVPAGASLTIEYESPLFAMTAKALAAGAPAVATPLGGIMFAIGCGSRFRDWSAASGARSGRRRLQGFRAANEVFEHRDGTAMLAELEAFMARSKDLDWGVQSQTRPIANATITTLRDRLSVPEGPAPPR